MLLSQKYRPLFFKDVYGHKLIVKELLSRISKSNIPQCMLFSGITGIGKSTISRLMGKAILCSNLNDGEPCNNCPTCVAINNENAIINYNEYCASDLNKEDMLQIKDTALKVSMGLSFSNIKIFYIEEMQELNKNKQAQKAILDILERKLSHTYFILATMDKTKIHKSLLNRCVQYNLKPLGYEPTINYLQSVLIKEKILDPNNVDVERAKVISAIVDNCDGSIRTALSYLERVIGGELWNTKDLFSELGIATSILTNSIIQGILKGEVSTLEQKIDEDLYKQLLWRLNLLYKYVSNIELNRWQKAQLIGINFKNIEIIQYTIVKLNELLKFTYLTKDLIEFTVLNIIMENKKRGINEQPKRRTRRG